MNFLLHRCLHALALVAAVSVGAFLLLEAAPGDYFTDLRANPAIPAATIERLRVDYALDQPLLARLQRWGASMLRGEMGLSVSWNRPVSEILWPRVFNTASLAAVGLGLAWAAGLSLGSLAAASRRWARPLSWLMTALTAIPDLLISVAILYMAVRMGWMSASNSLASAALALMLISLPSIFRHTTVSVRSVLGEPFVESARAHGLPEWRVWIGHVLPAAANPLISLFGLSVASLLSASLMVEVILGWPGLGPLLLEAIGNRDHPVVLATVVLSSLLLAGGNLLADLMLFAADPRIRHRSLS